MKATDWISIYCDADTADIIIGYLLDEIEGSSLCDDADIDLLDLDSYFVLVTLDSDGEIYIEDAYNEDGEIMDPCGLCYVLEDIPFKDLNMIIECADETIVFGITNNCDEFPMCDDKIDEEYIEYKDSDGKVHGFMIEGVTSKGTHYNRSVYSSDPLCEKQMETLLEIL